jgi:hypothetical protein
MEITGGCLCRSIRYRVIAPPIITWVCWCRCWASIDPSLPCIAELTDRGLIRLSSEV